MTPVTLKTFMLLRGWSAPQMAERVPVSVRTVFYWLSGKRQISPAMSERIKSLKQNAKPVKRKRPTKRSISSEDL